MLKKIKEKGFLTGRTVWGRRLLAFALCFAMSFSLVPTASAITLEEWKQMTREERQQYLIDHPGETPTEEPEDIGDPIVPPSPETPSEPVLKNTYLLRVDTGVSPGDNVLYFGVRYRDAGGTERTEYIFPHEGSLSAGYKLAEGYSSPKTRLQNVYTVTDYKLNNTYGNTDGLTAYSFDTYIFNPDYELKEVLGIDIFMRYPMDEAWKQEQQRQVKGWTCNGLYLYRVDEIYGVNMAGYYSDSYYVSFRGELLSKLKETDVDFNLDKTDVIYRLGRTQNVDYNLAAPEEAERIYDSLTDEYLFKIDLADVYKGGIEALVANYGDKGLKQVAEALTLSITYNDYYGETRTVNLPVITSMLAWAAENKIIDSPSVLAGVAQQGDSIMFAGTLPDFKEFTRFQFVYGSGAAAAAGITPTDGVIRSKRLETMENDQMNVVGIQIYGSDAKVNASMNGAMMDLSVDSASTPLYYFTAGDNNGFAIKSGKFDMNSRIKAYTPGATLVPPTEKSNYVVVISTDTMPSAGTTEDIQIKLGYLATDGFNKESNAIKLSEAAENFYGYWPGENGDSAYAVGVGPGGQLAFSLSLTDVNKFTSATFIMSSYAKDDWQMRDFRIYSAKDIGKRLIEWQDVGFSDRVISRPFDKSTCIVHYPNDMEALGEDDGKLYLNNRDYTKTIYFGEESQSVIEKKKPVDWNDIRYSMTYKEALQDLGFSYADSVYKVNVKVASNSDSNMDDGDCGSLNLFYFKLIFESGSSGYVLANQQLTADGFRAGQVESFYVTTNEDYGALTAVSIIPGDDNENTNKDPFDKLNIKYIDVVKQSDSGFAKTWKVGDVGWIDINYRDSGAESKGAGRPGRSEGEMAHTYTVSQRGYSVNFLFEMTTGSYERSATDVDYEASKNNPQYQGSMVATIEYYDNSGMIRKESVDIVRAMYEYANRDPNYYGETYVAADGTRETRAQTDPGFMFRGGHVDRFIVSLADVQQIIRIRLGASSEVSTTWNLERVDVYQITSEGQLQITTKDEYKRRNSIKDVCTSTDDVGYPLKVFAPETASAMLGEEQGMVVNFTQHKIELEEKDGQWTSTIERVPLGRNDSLNIYVHMNTAATESPMDDPNYQMTCSFGWNSAEGDLDHADPVGRLEKAADAHMFYATGIKAQGFRTLNYVTLKAQAAQPLNAHVDYVIVQHVRSGVTIGTYYLNFTGNNADSPNGTTVYYVDPDDGEPSVVTGNNQKQVVRLFFSPDMEEAKLMAGINDLVVAIRYKTTNDASRASQDNYYYNSRYIYLSDIQEPVSPGSQEMKIKYAKITPGMVAEIEFEEDFIQEITGVMVATVGNIKAALESACVGIYDIDTGKCTGWYSFANGAALSNTPYTIPTSINSVVPVKVTFKTGEDAKIISTGADSGTECPIRMKIAYTNSLTNAKEELTINDIRQYLTAGSFKKQTYGGVAATVEFFMKDVGAIRSFTLEPYTSDEATSAVWGLEDLYYEATINTQTVTGSVSVNKLLAEDSPVAVNVSKVLIKLRATAHNDATGIDVERNTDYGGTAEITIRSGKSVTITPTLVGSLDGYGYTVSAQTGTGMEVNCFTDSGSTVVFTPPANETSALMSYVVTIASEESPLETCSLTVNVEPLPVEKEVLAPAEETEEDTDTQEQETPETPADSGTEENPPVTPSDSGTEENASGEEPSGV